MSDDPQRAVGNGVKRMVFGRVDIISKVFLDSVRL